MALARTATGTIPKATLARLRTDYGISNDHQVVAFLNAHPFLIQVLEDARWHLTATFGPKTPVTLDLTVDPEEHDAALFARVHTDLSPDIAIARLDAFLDAWWLNTLPAAQGLIHFDVA